MRRIKQMAVALAAVATMTACTPPTDDPGSTPTADDPRAVLAAAVPDGDTPAHRFSVDDGEQAFTGVVDPATDAVDMAVRQEEEQFVLDMRFRFVADRSWVRLTFTSDTAVPEPLAAVSDTWFRVDPAKIEDEEWGQFDDADIWGVRDVVDGIVDVTADGAAGFRGTTDITGTEVVAADVLTALGAAAKAVPFTAAVDGEGRLTSFVLDVPAAGGHPAYRHSATYADYGAVAAPEPPARSTPAPPFAYELLNG